ncbi:MAG: (deoxy)nucleoside triphosphate pyrophosphohydrolase [Bacteroidales bacterium]|nr:(deoxy)nucleoside triphosphate pyrophosphohydrolase [Bacteroidales bacterium]
MMIDVSCAIILNDSDEILVVQRGKDTDHPLKWEFPGGKITQGESVEDSLIREIDEELSMDLIITGHLPPVEYDYRIKQVRLFPLVSYTLSDNPVLTEHVDYKWVSPGDLNNIDLCEADMLVAGVYLRNYNPLYNEDDILVADTGELDDAQKQHVMEMLAGKGGYNACDILAESVIENPALLGLLVDYSFSGDQQLAFRASYCITKAEEKSPGVAKTYYLHFIKALARLKNEAVIRAFLKILNTSDYKRMDEDHHGLLADSCFRWLNSASSAIAIKAYSMDALYKLSLIYPELGNELRSTILRIMEESSSGVKARGAQILKLLPE